MKTTQNSTSAKSFRKIIACFSIAFVQLLIMPGCSEEEVQPTPDYLNYVYKVGKVTESLSQVYGNGLTFRLYEVSANSDAKRPLILLSPGGGFTRYTRTAELTALGKDMARRGYVVGIVQYSLTPNTPGADIWVKGTIDQKNAVRYFKKNAETYRIDPDKIFLGGWSTGALLAMSCGFVSDGELEEISQTELRTSLEDALVANDSRNMYTEYTDNVKGLLCMAGWAFELNLFDNGDPAVMLINHEQALLGDGKTSIWGEFTTSGITNYGFDLIKDRLVSEGYTEGQNLEYIKMTGTLTMSQYGTVEAMSPKNFDSIAGFFHGNLQ